MRAVFMGTPAFAVPSLAAMAGAGHSVELVITQPDRPAGRKQKLMPPPVKIKALELGLAVFQPRRIKSADSFERLAAIAPDVIVVVGYGQIIPQRILDLPPRGCINVHTSLLPKYRGAAPVNWAVANGETRSGVTTMRLIFKLDAGDMLLQHATPIGPTETAQDLLARLAPIGAGLLVETLAGLEAGLITPRPQAEQEATYAPILKRADGEIDWNLPASRIYNRLRGFTPWPGIYTYFRGRRLEIHRARPLDQAAPPPGAVATTGGQLAVGCGEASMLALDDLQPEGKKRMAAADFVRGYRPQEGEVLGENTQ
ncbi:MAG TPA: methionyl-tRNA formyltransferase [Bryobacterales bacterium]|nr:methionyl-tRNA formyltransferase [Bryobacterales bacterium]